MGTIHLIIVANLDDPNIGISCGVDLRGVREIIKNAAAQTGMELKAMEITGTDFDAEHITAAVRGISPGRDDTVVFYYSGHGARGESKPDAWPVLSLASPMPPYDSFDLAWIYRELHSKQARMLLMFVDCCQEVLPDEMLSELSPEDFRGVLDIYGATNYRLLFQMFEGEVLLMSCKPGQLSGCNARLGGYFTATFLRALHAAVRSPRAASWDAVAGQGSAPPRHDQEPIWKVVNAIQMSMAHPPGMEPFPGDWRLGMGVEVSESILATASRAVAVPRRRFCTTCGAMLDQGDQFCSACGTPSEVSEVPPASSNPPVVSGDRPAIPSVQHTLNKILQRADSDSTMEAPLDKLDTIVQRSEQSPALRTSLNKMGSVLRRAEEGATEEPSLRKLDSILERSEKISALQASLNKMGAMLQRTENATEESSVENVDSILQRSDDKLARARKKGETQLEKLKNRLKDI
jgi:hypothetical protein